MISKFLKAALAAAWLMIGAAPALAQGSAKVEGVLNVVWGDPLHRGVAGETRFSLRSNDGTTYRLLLNGKQKNTAIAYFGARVTVTGARTADARGAPIIAAQAIEPIGAPKSRPVFQQRRVLYLLVKFKDDKQAPHSSAFFRALTNPLTADSSFNIPATINGFFDATSWGALQWKASSTVWMTLPHPKSYYANCGWSGSCADLDALANDAFALAEAQGVKLSRFDNINFVLNNDLDCCAWGGGVFHDSKFYGATWEPPWGQETGTYSHELGHSIGLPHSGWAYYDYDSPWDIMSARTSSNWLKCGSYHSINSGATSDLYCTEPGDGYIAPHKDYLGWIPDANELVIKAPETEKVTLQAGALPLGSALKMVKICLLHEPCEGSSAHYLTVEARLGVAKYDLGLTGDGVLIQDFQADRGAIGGPCYFNSQSGWVIPVDATPGDWDSTACGPPSGKSWPNYALGNAQFLPGQTYKNPDLHVVVKVLNKTGSGYVVRVTRQK